MKRNSKLLVLLAVLLSGILGVYFIGCEGDDTTIIEPPLEDKVLGSIEGVVTDAVSNEPLPNVRVAWRPQHSDETHSVTTDSIGYFLIDDDLPSG
ncbi:MAG: carboxypeptidase-like regulatory domain-containing protein, partial [Candidatus Zixiibacteriota bacterium]